MAKTEYKDIVIIGAGSAGCSAAFKIAELGFEVTLIGTESDPGGHGIDEAGISVKAVWSALQIKEEAAEAKKWGLEYEEPEIDMGKISNWKDKVVQKQVKEVKKMSEERKINYLQGTAKFISEREIEIKPQKEGAHTLKFKKVIIATGSVPVELQQAKFDQEVVINAATALEFKDIPKSLLVIGAGYSGFELGSIYAALGSKVSLVEQNSQVLSKVDQDLVKIFNQQQEGVFEDVLLETTVENVRIEKKKAIVKLKNKEKRWEKEYDRILVAMGRKPNTGNLDLKKANVETDEDGFIVVDKNRKTNQEHIYAIGDVTQKPLFANKAQLEGQIAAEVIAGIESKALGPKAIPSIIATPKAEIAWCGLTAAEAKEQGIEIKEVKFPWSASGRAASIGIEKGLTKLILDPKSGKILGGGAVGKRAGSLIAEITFAVEMSATAEDLMLTIHPHPTLSETIMESAETFFGSATHFAGK